MTRQGLIHGLRHAGRSLVLAPPTLLVVALCGVAGCASQVTPASSTAPGQLAVAPGTAVVLPDCPTALPKPGSYPAGPSTVMVSASPSAARVCRYAGLNGPQQVNSLVQAGSVNSAELLSLVSALDAARPMPTRPISCPMDDSSTDLVIFGYPDGHTSFVTVGLTGCNMVTNGAHTAHLTSGTALGQLAAVVGSETGPGQPGAKG